MTKMLTQRQARHLWIRAQKLDQVEPFGQGAKATRAAIEHLGYVQIDTINVIERCHHHILFTRIPSYKRQDLHQAQTKDKSVFEYWTHALAYVPTRDFCFYMRDMKRRKENPGEWYSGVKKADVKKVLHMIKREGAISIRDIVDDVLVEKDHDWGSRKPSKRALQLAFNGGALTISERVGMLKKYELIDRHFAWQEKPKAASEKETFNFLLERSLRSQSVVSLDSVCYLANAKKKIEMKSLIETRVKKNELVPILIKGFEKTQHWVRPDELETIREIEPTLTHILSPFDPLTIQRKRLSGIFNHDHRFEAYYPKEKRILGYFALPVLIEDEIVAALDLKADRAAQKLLIQKWTWLAKNKSAKNKKKIEEELHRFEKFQLHC